MSKTMSKTMSETLHEMAVRMSGGRCGKGCADCPAHAAMYSVGGGCLIRRLAKIENVDAQIDTLKKWASEHPRKTYKSVFLDSFPNALLNDKGVPVICRMTIFGEDSVGNCEYHCTECWNREVEGGDDQRGRI